MKETRPVQILEIACKHSEQGRPGGRRTGRSDRTALRCGVPDKNFAFYPKSNRELLKDDKQLLDNISPFKWSQYKNKMKESERAHNNLSGRMLSYDE